MRWRKLGLVWGPDGARPWARHSALQPTPLLRDDGTIRVFAGLRDDDGRSSVAWVDVDAADPTRVLAAAEEPALAKGPPGAWDEDGVVPAAIVERDGALRLYYAGYQRREDVRFQVFGGLAASQDGGVSFTRHGDGLVLGPSAEAPLFRVIHSIREEGGRWRAWYGAGGEFVAGSAKTLPVYDIRYAESPDGVGWPEQGQVVVALEGEEHRVGRPYVVGDGDAGYRMFFGSGTDAVPYRLTYATSPDGVGWQRRADLGIDLGPGPEDDVMMAYPAVVATEHGTWLFYNGNDYGRAGVMVAALEAG